MFLGRLWTLFGRPTALTDGGYSYSVHDRDTGLLFGAYAGASGPAYGAAPRDAKRLDSALAAFDALLDKTSAAECRLEIPIGDDKTFVVGMKNGKPFEELVPRDQPSLFARVIHDVRIGGGVGRERILRELRPAAVIVMLARAFIVAFDHRESPSASAKPIVREAAWLPAT